MQPTCRIIAALTLTTASGLARAEFFFDYFPWQNHTRNAHLVSTFDAPPLLSSRERSRPSRHGGDGRALPAGVPPRRTGPDRAAAAPGLQPGAGQDGARQGGSNGAAEPVKQAAPVEKLAAQVPSRYGIALILPSSRRGGADRSAGMRSQPMSLTVSVADVLPSLIHQM